MVDHMENVTYHAEGGGHGEESITGIDFRFFTSFYMDVAYFICVFIATVVSIHDIKEHVQRFNFPKIQVYIVRVLLMVPVYGILSFASINVPRMRFILDTVRDTYESIVLYMFFLMLIAYGGGEGALIRALNKKKYKGIHPVPLCYLPLFNLDQNFFLRCKRMVLQYAIWKPCASLIACVLEPYGLYTEGDFSFNNAYIYVYIMYNITLSYSLYYLVLFEIETEKELRYCKAGMKFLCIKSLIFFAFWQSMLISMCVGAGLIYVGDEHEAEHVQTTIINGLICLELLPVSYLHHMAFGREKLSWKMAAQPVFHIETEEMTARQGLDLSLTFDGVFTDLLATVFYRKGKLLDEENAEEEEESQGGNGELPLSLRGVQDPTVEELVQFAFNNDRGIRPDGLLWVPDSSDEECFDDKVEYKDTDIIDPNFSVKVAREGGDAALNTAIATAAVDMVLASDMGQRRSSKEGEGLADEIGGGGAADIFVFCSVCGRFDRELVKRKDNNYKCVECVGSKSIKELKNVNKKFTTLMGRTLDKVGLSAITGGDDDVPYVNMESGAIPLEKPQTQPIQHSASSTVVRVPSTVMPAASAGAPVVILSHPNGAPSPIENLPSENVH